MDLETFGQELFMIMAMKEWNIYLTDRIHIEAEETDSLQSFQIFHSRKEELVLD